VKVWDLGSVDALTLRSGAADRLAPTYSILTATTDPQVLASGTNKVGAPNDPSVVARYDVSVDVQASRTFPTFRETAIVANAVAPGLQGDYHLNAGSPALNSGSYTSLTTALSTLYHHDFDGQTRPTETTTTHPDIGADERP
jgi:hypothetical protein